MFDLAVYIFVCVCVRLNKLSLLRKVSFNFVLLTFSYSHFFLVKMD